MVKNRGELPLSVLLNRWKEMGIENDDFQVNLTVSDLKNINDASCVLKNVSEIMGILQDVSRVATEVIDAITFKYRYDPYIERYPDDIHMIAERDAMKEKLKENISKMIEISKKVRNATSIFLQ